ncbi:MAG: chloride channel protein [Muribaculaceae bacterium]|nr:chloride channel protein [Muribaculaceae bacterium]
MATLDPTSNHHTSLPQTPDDWRLGPLPPAISLFALAGAMGMLLGVTAFVLKGAIKGVSLFLVGHLRPDHPNWALLMIPVVGILLAVAFQKYVARRNLEHGTDKVEGMLKAGNYHIPGVFSWGPLVASVFTLGFGGSAGAEGPIATSGASFGSYLARRFGLPSRLMRIMIGCGAGAGIAAIFKAPIGGVLFTVEVMGMEMATVPLIALIVACLVAGMSCYALTGFTLDVPLTHVQMFDPKMSGWIMLLGVVCGIYSLYYTYIGRILRHIFNKIGNRWLTALFSGAILAVLLFAFPALYGEGYSTMASIIDGDTDALIRYSIFNRQGIAPDLTLAVMVCLGVALAKPMACISSNSGGGVAGDFAPTLFAGCMAGMFFAGGFNDLCGLGLPVNNFAVSAMAGVMAGVIHAPLMAIFIVIEMTGYYGMTFPVMLAAGFSYGTVLVGKSLSHNICQR